MLETTHKQYETAVVTNKFHLLKEQKSKIGSLSHVMCDKMDAFIFDNEPVHTSTVTKFMS